MKIAFHDNSLSLRGTTVAIYDWDIGLGTIWVSIQLSCMIQNILQTVEML